MPKQIRYAFFALIALLLAFNVYRIYQKNWNFGDPIDFRGLYLGSKLMQEKLPLYSDSMAAVIWLELKENEGFESTTDFGDQWVSIMVYPPQAFTLPYFFGKFNWHTARVLWWFLCLASLAVVAFLLFKLTHNFHAIWLLLAFKGSFFALALGQPLLLVLALLFLSIYYEKSKPILAGLFLGCAMIKFNLAIPIALYFLVHKDWKLLISGAITALVLLLPSLLVYEDIIPQYLAKVSSYYEMIYQINERNIYTFSDSEMSMMLNYYFPQDISFWKQFNSIGQLLGYGFVSFAFVTKRISSSMAMLGFLLFSFAFSYHLVYDAMIFILPICLIKQPKWYWIAVFVFLIFSLPLNAVFPHISFLNFHYPLLIGSGLIVYIFASLKTLNGPSSDTLTH